MSVVKFTTKGRTNYNANAARETRKGVLSSSFLIYYCSSSRSIVMKQQQLSKKMTTSGFIFQIIIISYSSVLYIRINWNHADTRRATTAKEPDADSTTQPTNDSGISE